MTVNVESLEFVSLLASDWWRQCRAGQGPAAPGRSERAAESGAGGEHDEEGSGAVPRVVHRDFHESEETYV